MLGGRSGNLVCALGAAAFASVSFGAEAFGEEAPTAGLAQIKVGVALTDSLLVGGSESPRRSKDYRLELNKGDSVQIDIESEAFDTAIMILEGDGLQRRMLASDDDGGTNLNSRLRFTAPQTAGYVVRAMELGPISDALSDGPPQDAGFRLVVVKDEPRKERPVRALILGQPNTGSLSEDDSTSDGQSSRDVFTFQGAKGGRLVASLDINVNANESRFQRPRASLRLERPQGGLVRGSSEGFGTNRYRLAAVLPDSGEYRLSVSGRALRGAMPYTLSARLETVIERPVGNLVVGSPLTGQFTYRDPETTGAAGEESGSIFHAWRLTGRRGETVRLELCAKGLDPRLQVLSATAIGERLVSENDDAEGEGAPPCGDTLSARLDVTFARDDAVKVLALPGQLTEGTYTLTTSKVTNAPAPPPAR